MTHLSSSHPLPVQEGYVPVENARLYYRELGQGQPIIILHGGPDFDHQYLLPELDRLSESFHLIYYDQRGRGKSGENVAPQDVSLESEIEDLEKVREHFHLESAAILGHSWGGVLAAEYAIRHPQHVSNLIFLNTAPLSHTDLQTLRESRRRSEAVNLEKMKVIAATDEYKSGDVETEAAYYRLHFYAAMYDPERYLERVIQSLRVGVTPEGVRKARDIEYRLYDQTWSLDGYDLLPALKELSIPTLVLRGDHDFIPSICSEHVAQAIARAGFVELKACGHFSFIEQLEGVYREILGFMK